MPVKKARKLRDGLLLAGLLITLLGYLWKPLCPIGIVVMLGCLIPHCLYVKCPHCGKPLGRNDGDFCQFCGKPLDD